MNNRMRRTATLLCLLVLLVAGCGPSTGENPIDEPVTEPAEEPELMDVTVYLTNSDATAIVATTRQVAATDDPEELLKRALAEMRTVTEAERQRGLQTELPDVEPLRVELARPVAVVEYPRELEQMNGAARVQLALSQIAATAASIPGVGGVELLIAGERVGTSERPFTTEGVLFHRLVPVLSDGWLGATSPVQAVDLFIAAIGDACAMWELLGPRARGLYGDPSRVEVSAFSEGYGAWRDYEVEAELITGDEAVVIISGDVTREGTREPDAVAEIYLVRHQGCWQFDFRPPEVELSTATGVEAIADGVSVTAIPGLPQYFTVDEALGEEAVAGRTGERLIILKLTDYSWRVVKEPAWWVTGTTTGLLVGDGQAVYKVSGEGDSELLASGSFSGALELPDDQLLVWSDGEWVPEFSVIDNGNAEPLEIELDGYFGYSPGAWWDDQVIISARSSRRDRAIAYSESGFAADIFAVDLQGRTTQLSSAAEGQFHLYPRRLSEEALGWLVTTRDGAVTHVVTCRRGEDPTMHRVGSNVQSVLWGPDGRWWLELSMIGYADETANVVVTLASPEGRQPLVRVGYTDRLSSPVISPDGTRLLVTIVGTSEDRGEYRTHAVALP